MNKILSQEISRFVSDLSELAFGNAFNPWSDRCALHDRPDAVDIRCRNLREVLEAAAATPKISLWIARDLSHRGGRRTGLAMTDEPRLPRYAEMFPVNPGRATIGREMTERTAVAVWDMLERTGRPVFLWNVFPLHPHMPDKPWTNRCHKAVEREEGLRFLKRLIALLNPEKIVAIGNEAHRAVENYKSDFNIFNARHPSFGGTAQFGRDIGRAYGL